MKVSEVWRFRLEDPRTGHRHGFADLDALVEFIRAELVRDQENAID